MITNEINGVEAKHPDWVMWEAELSAETCDKIIEACSELESHGATMIGTDGLDPRRITQLRWITENNEGLSWIREIVEEYTHKANEHFKVDLTDLQPIQFTEYNEIGSHYDMHHDVEWDNQRGNHRKVSFVLQLSDGDEYEGGDFEICKLSGSKELPKINVTNISKKIITDEGGLQPSVGTIIIFPSYVWHRVAPVTKGVRKSLVGWILGKPFR